MSKELEIMKEERERLVQEDYADICIEECDLVIKALQRLEAIDNAEPSEALECLEALEQDIKDRVILAEDRQLKLCAIIKQALLKAQEHNSVNLLMQELDCKDFADLRKYARCGYEKLNNK